MFIYVYSPHIYDAVEMRSQYSKAYSSSDYKTSRSKIIPTKSEKDMKTDDMKTDNVELQENPAYAAKTEYY